MHEIDSPRVPEALGLVRAVFQEHVAPLYASEGMSEFERYASIDAQAKRLASGYTLFVAEEDGERVVGVAELRESAHLSMLFVETAHQRKGVGRSLLSAILARCRSEAPDFSELTVHASPNSVGAYRQLGFMPQGPEQEQNGIRFIPMVHRGGGSSGA